MTSFSEKFSRIVFRVLKIIGLLLLVIFLVFAAFYAAGKIITSEIETVDDSHDLASWGPGTSFLSTSSGETHILDIGEGDVILLIHGSAGSLADWQEGGLSERLAESYRVVAFDSYGFGLSERNNAFEYGYPLWTQQALDVLDALEIDHALVVGHSAGAVVAVALGAYYPERVRGIVLTSHGFAADAVQMVPMLPGIGEFWAARQTVIGDTFSNSYRERAEAVHRISGTRAAYLAFIRSQVLQLASAEGRQIAATIYESIDAPVLQLHGEDDQSQDIESARALSPRIADTHFVAIEGSDHHVHIDALDRWLEEVTTFAANLQP